VKKETNCDFHLARWPVARSPSHDYRSVLSHEFVIEIFRGYHIWTVFYRTLWFIKLFVLVGRFITVILLAVKFTASITNSKQYQNQVKNTKVSHFDG